MEMSRKILLIEEDREFRAVLRRLLEGMNHRVIPFEQESETADADLLVADVAVPDSPSITWTEELLSRRNDLNAVLISTDDTEFEVRRRFADDRTRFLLKPFSADALEVSVSKALRLDRPHPRAVNAMDAVRESGPAGESGPAPTGRASRRQPRRFVVAGMLAAAVVVVLSSAVLLDTASAPPSLPEFEMTVERGGSLAVLEPMGDIPELPVAFTWEEVVNAESYRMRILAVDDALLWEGTAGKGAVALSPQLRELLQPRVVYFWTVEALDADGMVLSGSEHARFQIIPLRRR